MPQIYEINPRLSFISQFFLKNIGNSLFVIMVKVILVKIGSEKAKISTI